MFCTPDGQLDPAVQIQTGIEILQVPFDRADLDFKGLGNFTIPQPAFEQGGDFDFPRGE